jgi:4,5:9,10-diseco-3-hydroxy-5,9,17-trioxoandrosta-1(10),2-diene-4-oate hydrolase
MVRGESTPLLLIHGFGEFLEVWWLNIEPLSEHYRVYAIDMLGHGLSDKPVNNYTLPSTTSFISDFMQTLGIESAHLIGHSLGGVVCLDMAIKFPEKIGKVILSDCGGLSGRVPFLYKLCLIPILGEAIMKPTLKPSIRYGMKRRFHNPEVVTDEMVDKDYEYIRMPQAKRAMLDIVRTNIDFHGLRPDAVIIDRLHLVREPTLFIHGEQDTVIPLADVQKAYKLMPDARLKVMNECGHCPHIEKAAEFNQAVIEFLKSGD